MSLQIIDHGAAAGLTYQSVTAQTPWDGLLLIVAMACLVLAGLGCAYSLLSCALMRRFARRRFAPVVGHPSITLLKPLHGDEPWLLENLTSFCDQAYLGPVQIVFGVRCADDPALAAVEALRRRRPQTHIDLAIDPRQHGCNRKISNVINMMAKATGEVLVLADSDVRVGAGYLAAIVDALNAPKVGLVTCLYRGRATDNLWSRLAAMDMDLRFAPSVVLGRTLGLGHPCLGPTMALRRTTLDRIGGFERVVEHLADDYRLGCEVRRLGLNVEFADLVIEHSCPETSLAALYHHELRWARTIRLLAPAGYAASALTHVTAPALLAVVAATGRPWSLALLATALAVRFWVAHTAGRALARGAGDLWLLPLRDILSFGVFVMSFFGDRVVWRGARYSVSACGRMRERPVAARNPAVMALRRRRPVTEAPAKVALSEV